MSNSRHLYLRVLDGEFRLLHNSTFGQVYSTSTKIEFTSPLKLKLEQVSIILSIKGMNLQTHYNHKEHQKGAIATS